MPSWSRVQLAALVAVLVVSAACHDAPTQPRTVPTQPSGVGRFDRDTATVLLDDSLVLVPVIVDGSGRSSVATATDWSSSAPAIADVDAKGHVHTLDIGTAVISASVGDSVARATVTVVPRFAQIATGGLHACGVAATGRLYCWGFNDQGQLGATTPACASVGGDCSAFAVAVGGDVRFVTVTVGDAHTCALTAAGQAYCWGANYYGQLGTGSTASHLGTPTPVSGSHTFVSLAAGRMHTCGVTATGEAYCWGWDYWGQLGGAAIGADRCAYFYSDEPCSRTPVLVSGDHQFVALTASDRATCGRTPAGEVYCWGLEVGGSDGTYCQNGQRTDCSRAPVRAGDGLYTDFAMGDVHKCGRSTTGTLSCWGANYYGAFGNGTTSGLSETPVVAAGGAFYAAITSGRTHMCGIDGAGDAQCWGANDLGQAGDGTAGGNRLSPVGIAGGQRFAVLVSSPQSSFTCGLSTAGRAYCWGDGQWGQLGNGELAGSARPVAVRVLR